MWSWVLLAAAILAGGYALWRTAFAYPPTDHPLRRLGRGEAAFFDRAAEAIFPAGGAIPVSGGEAEVSGYLDRLLDASQPRIRLLIHLLVFLMEHATLAFPAPGKGGMRRFSALTLQQRVEVLDGWATSRLFPRRLVFTSLRALLTMGYFAHPPVLRHLGLAPLAIESPVLKPDLWYPPIGQPFSAIPYVAADLTDPSAGVPLHPDDPVHPGYAEHAP